MFGGTPLGLLDSSNLYHKAQRVGLDGSIRAALRKHFKRAFFRITTAHGFIMFHHFSQ